MEHKAQSNTETVTVEQLKTQLSRTNTVSPEEERVLRMRHGVGTDPRAPLPRAAGANAELADELLLMEMQLLRASRQRNGTARAAPAATMSPTKAKIVRALRKKK